MKIQKYIFCEYCMLWQWAVKGFQPEGARFFRKKVLKKKRTKLKKKVQNSQSFRLRGGGGELPPLPPPF